ncbi:MAG: hypothetical protein ABDH59_05980, partial [Fervidobacterium sp.]
AKLGTAVFKPQDVKYVLMDETRTDLEGSVGILLKNGIWLLYTVSQTKSRHLEVQLPTLMRL